MNIVYYINVLILRVLDDFVISDTYVSNGFKSPLKRIKTMFLTYKKYNRANERTTIQTNDHTKQMNKQITDESINIYESQNIIGQVYTPHKI